MPATICPAPEVVPSHYPTSPRPLLVRWSNAATPTKKVEPLQNTCGFIFSTQPEPPAPSLPTLFFFQPPKHKSPTSHRLFRAPYNSPQQNKSASSPIAAVDLHRFKPPQKTNTQKFLIEASFSSVAKSRQDVFQPPQLGSPPVRRSPLLSRHWRSIGLD